jgi:hypothetical protein
MTPDIDLQLVVVVRALKGIVWDSVPTENISARENLRMSIATLEFVLQRHSFQSLRAAAELRNAIELAEKVAPIAGDPELDEALGAAKLMADETWDDAKSLDRRRTRLSSAVCDSVERARDPTVKLKIAEAIILASKGQLDLARAWCLPAGFEANPKLVPSLEEVLGRTRDRGSAPFKGDA